MPSIKKQEEKWKFFLTTAQFSLPSLHRFIQALNDSLCVGWELIYLHLAELWLSMAWLGMVT